MAVSGRYKTPGSALGASTGGACTAIHNTANTVQIVEPNKKRRRGRRRIRRNRLTGSVIWGEDGKRISRTKEQNENRLDFFFFATNKSVRLQQQPRHVSSPIPFPFCSHIHDIFCPLMIISHYFSNRVLLLQ